MMIRWKKWGKQEGEKKGGEFFSFTWMLMVSELVALSFFLSSLFCLACEEKIASREERKKNDDEIREVKETARG